MNYKLSICIPTYNRKKYLKQLIDNILSQIKDTYLNDVEICISDNASTDGTGQLLAEYQKLYDNINYFICDKNMGADNNYLKVVDIANGKYCWLFGSDDMIVENGINKILSELKTENDIYLVNRTECDINMQQLKKTKIFKYGIQLKTFSLGTTDKLIYYLKSLNSLNGIFSYLSAIIFKKEQWDMVIFDNRFIGTLYAHSYILLSMLKKDITLKYIDDYIVLNRGDNDSFSEEGIIKRIKIDFDGYKLLFKYIFNDNKVNVYYKHLLKKAHPYYRITYILSELNKNDRKLLLNIIKDAQYNQLLLKSAIYIYFFFPYKIFRYFYRKFLMIKNKKDRNNGQ